MTKSPNPDSKGPGGGSLSPGPSRLNYLNSLWTLGDSKEKEDLQITVQITEQGIALEKEVSVGREWGAENMAGPSPHLAHLCGPGAGTENCSREREAAEADRSSRDRRKTE